MPEFWAKLAFSIFFGLAIFRNGVSRVEVAEASMVWKVKHPAGCRCRPLAATLGVQVVFADACRILSVSEFSSSRIFSF